MCRRHELWAWMLICFGAGILFGCFFESGFFCCSVGIGVVILGAGMFRRK